MPDKLHTELLAALRNFEAAVAATAQAGQADLSACFRALDELERRLPSTADAGLRHFLANKSYQKARRLLEAQSAPPRA